MLAWAHDPGHEVPDIWSAWSLDPYVLVLLIAAAILYWRGVRRAWARAGVGRGVRRWKAATFTGGMAGLFFALVWPLDVLGELLFSVHMVQHVVLMNIAAPLLVLGAPLQVMIRGLPSAGRRAAARMVPRPGVVFATVLQLVVLWAWHTPRGVAAALERDAVHIVMHASLLVAALVFWTAVLRPRRGGYWAPIAGLAVTLKLTGLACIALLLQPNVLYTAYGDTAAAWGLSRAEDEQLAWGVMMVLGSVSYLTAAIALLAISLVALERADAARDVPARSPFALQQDHYGGDMRE